MQVMLSIYWFYENLFLTLWSGEWTRTALLSELLTFKEVFDAQVPHAEAQDGQLVEPGAHVLGERQQVHQPVQLPVQPIPVALRRVGLDDFIAAGDLLPGKGGDRT